MAVTQYFLINRSRFIPSTMWHTRVIKEFKLEENAVINEMSHEWPLL